MRIDGAMPRTRLRISASASRAWSRASTTRSFAARRVGVHLVGRQPEVDREHDEPLLRPVVEVALDPPELGRLDVEHRLAAHLQRLDPLLERRRPRVAQEDGDDLPVERHEALRRERRHRQQDDARDERHDRHGGRVERREPREGGQDGPRRDVEAAEDVAGEQRPHGDREQEQRRAPERNDGRELEHGQRERDEHVADVPPPVGVEEQGREELADAGAVRPVRVRDERAMVGDQRPPALDPGDDPRPLDREHDEDDADADEQQRDAGRQDPDDRQEREQLHPEAGDDGAGGEPGRRVERSADEAGDDAPLPLRVLGPEGAEDEEQPQEQERDADHAGSEPGCGGSVEVASSS